MAGGRGISDLGVSAPIVAPGYTPFFHASAAHAGAIPNGPDLATYRGESSSPHVASPNDARTFGAPAARVDQHARVEQVAQVAQPERLENRPQTEVNALAAILGSALDDLKREVARRHFPLDSQDEDKDEAVIYFGDVVEAVLRGYVGELTQSERDQMRQALWAELPNCVFPNHK